MLDYWCQNKRSLCVILKLVQCRLQGEATAQRQSWAEAEGFFLRAKQPDLALAMYRKARLWEAALRIAEDYLPAKVSCSLLQARC